MTYIFSDFFFFLYTLTCTHLTHNQNMTGLRYICFLLIWYNRVAKFYIDLQGEGVKNKFT